MTGAVVDVSHHMREEAFTTVVGSYGAASISFVKTFIPPARDYLERRRSARVGGGQERVTVGRTGSKYIIYECLSLYIYIIMKPIIIYSNTYIKYRNVLQ